jgi:6-phosphogluconolactonase
LTLYRAGKKDVEKAGAARTRPGAGPRHVAVDPSGRFVYVINELDSTVASYAFNDVNLTLEPIGVYATIPPDAAGTNYSADLQISADGRFLYGTNRGHDSIVAFEANPSSGQLSHVGNVPCGGRTPRNIALSPGGRFLLCANQDSDVVTIFARDGSTGMLRNTHKTIRIGTPMCLRFASTDET